MPVSFEVRRGVTLTRKIIVVGAGGMGRELASLILDIEKTHPGTWSILGFIADAIPNSRLLNGLGLPYLGSIEWACESEPAKNEYSFVVGIGNGNKRFEIESKLERAGLNLETLIHPSAVIGHDVEIGKGSVVCASSVITTNVLLGKSVQVNIGSMINHDVNISDYVTLSPGVRLTGSVSVGRFSTIFTNSTVLPGVQIGANATVGAGSVVISDIKDGITTAGNPSRVI